MPAIRSPVMVTLQSQFLIEGQPVIPKGINVQDYTPLVSMIGAKYVRLRFKWSDVEPVQGTFDWSSLDKVVAAYSADHVNMLLDNHPIGVQNIPAWAFPNPQENAFGLLAALADHYCSQPYVWGYEVWNEPHWGTADAAGTISVLRWMAKAQAIIRAHDPTRATVMMIRDSWNLGLQNADLRRWLPDLQHLVLDVHDSYATGSNAGYSDDGEGHAADMCKTTWPCAVPYSGIYQHQLDHLKWVLRWKAELNRPIIVGEWDWMTMQPGWDKYQRQMLSIFDELNLPWFRWQGGTQSLMDKGVLNPMGQQIADALN
jgi:hypothetical protein